MKKIQNTAAPVVVTTQRTPLTVKLSVTADSGRLTQAQDEAQALWNPDRITNPLILKPTFSVYDPDQGTSTIIQPGTNNAEFAWYRESVSQENLITSTTVTDLYYLETGTGNVKTGRLVVRKNVSYNEPEKIICRVTYADNLRDYEYYAEESVLLTSENKPEEFYSVKIQDANPIVFSPLTDETSTKAITSLASKGDTPLVWSNVVGKSIGAVDLGTLTWTYSSSIFSASLPSPAKTTGSAVAAGYNQIQNLSVDDSISTSTGGIRVKDASYNNVNAFKKAVGGKILFYELATKTVDMAFEDAMALVTMFFWYCDDVLIPTDGTFPAYISGQGTETLTVDLDFIDGKNISVKLGMPTFEDSGGGIRTVVLPSTPNVPATDSVLVKWEWGKLSAIPIAKGASTVKQKSSDKPFFAVVKRNNVDVDDAKAEEYVRLNWKTHATDANYSVKTDYGWGKETIVPASALRKTGSVNVEVTPEMYTLGVMDRLIDDSSGSAPNFNGYTEDDSGSSSAGNNGGFVVGRE